MNNTSTSQSEAVCATDVATSDRTVQNIKVWDAPVRVSHWLIAFCFASAFLSAETDSLRWFHVTMGYTMAGLICFRLVWGFIGSRYARFTEFVRSPAKVASYLRAMFSGRPTHFTGHNPAGAVAILIMLGLGMLVTASGYANYNELGGEWLEDAHELAANIMLGVVAIHIAGVLIASYLHRENLVRSMIDGSKLGQPQQSIRNNWRTVAAVLVLTVTGFWVYQWQTASSAPTADITQSGSKHTDKDDD